MSLEDRYQWLFRKTPALTASLDEEGRFVDASDAWVTRFGYRRDELKELKPEDLASPDCAREIAENYRPLLRRTGRLDWVPVNILTKSGELVECLSSAIVELSDAGNYLRTVVVYTELAEQAQVQSRYRRLYRATPAMLHTVDDQGRLLHVSDRWLQKLGFRREEVIGRPITDFMAPEYQALLGDRLKEIIAAGDFDNQPRHMLTSDGEIVECLMSAVADRDESGRVGHLLVAVKDVTERNQAERKLRAAFEENARLRQELEMERDYLREEVHLSMNFGQIIGESTALKKMLARVEAVAETSASVLVEGESGVGKELVARVLHNRSPRAEKPLVKVNCASIPHELFESEFFGHIKGAFTGAHRDRVGRFQLADGGTLFLDEVGEIPVDLQGKLLRVLQENEFERVGDDRTLSVDVRVIAATNQDLEAAVRDGRFREDLYYRLSVFPIEVPPLRDRGDDIVQLASHFLTQACKDFRHSPMQLSSKQVDLLKSYSWPGNVRELKNVIERAVILSKGKTLRLDLGMAEVTQSEPQRETHSTPEPQRILTEEELKQFEKDNLLRALEATNWRVSGPNGAATVLGVKATTLRDRMRKFGLKPARPAAAG